MSAEETTFNAYTPAQRARALYYYFGWQGGTIHQLAEATGVSAADILYGEHGGEHAKPGSSGFSAVRTCSRDWRRDKLAPQHQGDWVYWRDVVIGFWVTGPLDQQAT